MNVTNELTQSLLPWREHSDALHWLLMQEAVDGCQRGALAAGERDEARLGVEVEVEVGKGRASARAARDLSNEAEQAYDSNSSLFSVNPGMPPVAAVSGR